MTGWQPSVESREVRSVAALGALAALVAFGLLQAMAFALAGTFEYPLDDVYIHLAMAEGIAAGGYGFNPGEAASASSSILYPFLLAPWPGTGLQRFLPLLWNAAGVALLGFLWGRAVDLSEAPRRAAVLLAVSGPLALNMPGVAFTGMENTLHAAAALAVVLGLWSFLRSGRISPWFVIALILSPLLRYEGLALSALSALAVALRGRPLAGVVLLLAVFLPVAAFSAWLVSLGLEPMPGPILAKVGFVVGQAEGQGRLIAGFLHNLSKPQAWLVAALIAALLALSAVCAGLRRPPASALIAVLVLAGIAHLMAGQFGWMHRYEHYLVICLVAGLLLVRPQLSADKAWLTVPLTAIALAGAALAFLPKVLTEYVWNPRAIHLQQAQMGRFLHDSLPWPVAVNDLGWAAWDNDAYVLDLWGLGSAEARATRLAGAEGAWAGPLAAAHGIRAAIIYDKWFGAAVGPDWVRVARLHLLNPRGRLGDWTVSFYATSAADVPAMSAALRAFAPTLPPDATLSFEEAAP